MSRAVYHKLLKFLIMETKSGSFKLLCGKRPQSDLNLVIWWLAFYVEHVIEIKEANIPIDLKFVLGILCRYILNSSHKCLQLQLCIVAPVQFEETIWMVVGCTNIHAHSNKGHQFRNISWGTSKRMLLYSIRTISEFVCNLGDVGVHCLIFLLLFQDVFRLIETNNLRVHR